MPSNYVEILSEQFDCSTSLVYKVFRGTRYRPDILDASIELAKAKRDKAILQMKVIHSLQKMPPEITFLFLFLSNSNLLEKLFLFTF